MEENSTQQKSGDTWKERMQDYIDSQKISQQTSEEKEREVHRLFREYMANEEENRGNVIEKFYYKNPLVLNELQLAVKSEAKQRFLITISAEIPDKGKLREIWYYMKKSISAPMDNTERINYKDFVKVADHFGSIIKPYFTATNFLKFDRDRYGRIDVMSFFHFLVNKTTAQENKIMLSYHDVYSLGFLTDKDLENYIKEEFKTFYFYNDISEDLKEYYLLVAQRKFFFYLDPKRTGKILIKDIVSSPILKEFLEMKERSVQAENNNLNNWFSNTSFFKIYRKYIDLDRDRNGMLSKEELIRYGPGLTMIFIERIFEEYQKYENAIDFKQFIDFCLAMENKKSQPAIQYFWRALDIYHKNYIDTFVINLFFRQIVKKLTNRNKLEYKVDDIKDEIWDMVKPKNEKFITLEDVLASSHFELILPLLFDAKAFLHHDQKEMFLVEEFEEIEDEMI